MPRGDKSAYTAKQKRMAAKIEKGYEDRGRSEDEAERIAWATVNKEYGGGKTHGSGRGRRRTTSSSRRGGVRGGSSPKLTHAKRSRAAKKGWATRRKSA